MMTSTWPHTHGIRSNYVADDEKLPVKALPQLLRENGYRTAVVGDWAASDLGKFDLGFDIAEVPDDQWNLKYMIRQGPKDMRLFLGLFARNRFGKRCLPEIHYAPGTPLTAQVGRDARALISALGDQNSPFFLNMFVATTHLPFSSAHPYYRMYGAGDYRKDSLFCVSGLTNPKEIVERQKQGEEAFDVDQIVALYDGCVRAFDDEVGKILMHLERCGLRDNTIVIIYSDHGTDLFEQVGWGQGNVISCQSNNIPLIISDPRRKHARNTTDATVSSVDLAPTIAALIGIPQPADWEGSSLTEYFDAEGSGSDRVVFAESAMWIVGDLPGLHKNHLSYPDIFESIVIDDVSTGTLSVRESVRNQVALASVRMAQEGPWRLLRFPTTDGPVYELINIHESGDGGPPDHSREFPELFSRLKDELTRWARPDELQR